MEGIVVRKKVLLWILAILLLMPVEVFGAVYDLAVLLPDYVVLRNVTYNISFRTSTALYGGRDTIYIRFPQEIEVAEGISAVNVSVNNREVPGIDYSNGLLALLVPASINFQAGEIINVGIASGAIRNPELAGEYRVSAYTSKDSVETYSPYFTITDYEYSNGVSKPLVQVTTSQRETQAGYQLDFKTSPNGRLLPGEKIYISFPSGTEVPDYIEGNGITINGIELDRVVQTETRRICLTVPGGLTIPARGAVKIIIPESIGIKHPSLASNTTLRVSTSVEPREITSYPYEIKESIVQSQNISVNPYPDGKSQNASYTITIKGGYLNSYTGSITGLVLKFPRGTGIPTSISSSSIKINGNAVSGVLPNPNNNEIIVIMSSPVSYNSQLIIAIDKTAGMVNPGPAQYKLEVGVLQATDLSDYYIIRDQSSAAAPPASGTGTIPSPQTPTSSPQKIVLRIGSLLADVDNTLATLDAAPVISNEVTLVPLRFLSQQLGAVAQYDSAKNCVDVKYGDKEMTLWINSRLARVDGQYTTIQAPAALVNNRLLVPIRFISEHFGCQVNWDGGTQSVTITQGEAMATTTTGTTNSSGDTIVSSPALYPVGGKANIKATNSYVNVRSGPDTSYALVTRVYRGESMTILAVQGDWYKVRLNSGQEAYVASWVVEVSN
jgi:hypothetical protein